MPNYFVDILEPSDDFNKSINALGRGIGSLYQKAWEQSRHKLYPGRTYNLNIQAVATMWIQGLMKIFVAVDKNTKEAIGFLSGIVYRPLYYDAHLFQVQDWYTGGDEEMEKDLFEYMLKSVRILGCNELWFQDDAALPSTDIGDAWELSGEHTIRRYVKKG